MEQAKNPVMQFIVILQYLNGNKKRHLFLFNCLVHLIPMWLIKSVLGAIPPISSVCSFIQ